MDSKILGPVYQSILDMAKKNGVSYTQTPLGQMGEAISRLSDNDLKHSDATRALVALRRAGVLDAKAGHDLLEKLMDEIGVL